MFIEMLDLLRCVRQHEEIWLVASIEEMHERSVREGILGCPVCGAQYRITGGIADFSEGAPVGAGGGRGTSSPEDIALRAAAFLALAEQPGTVLLGGEWSVAEPIVSALQGVRVFAANAPSDAEESPAGAGITVSSLLPFARGSLSGVALDGSFGQESLRSAVACLRPGGRVIVPAGFEVPVEIGKLASDASYWVGEKTPAITPLRRANR